MWLPVSFLLVSSIDRITVLMLEYILKLPLHENALETELHLMFKLHFIQDMVG